MINAAGTIFISLTTKRVLLNFRSNDVKSPKTWGFIGGKVNSNERILEGLSREIREEIGFIPQYKAVFPLDIYNTIDKRFSYYTYAILVEDEFVPFINRESGGWGWFDIDCLPKPLHAGCKAVLLHNDFAANFEKILDDNSN
jgi:8-oxo-dGTP pyrophosphatase MutT (NUDIX family)